MQIGVAPYKMEVKGSADQGEGSGNRVAEKGSVLLESSDYRGKLCACLFFSPEHLLTKLGGLECNPIRGKTPAIAQCRMVYWAKDPKTDILLRES